MSYKLRFSQYNERSILVEWPAIIDENVLHDVLNFKTRIELKIYKPIVDIISTYASLLIIYNTTIENVNDEFSTLKVLYKSQDAKKLLKSKTFRIPVCYEDEFAMDLDNYSVAKNLSKSALIKLHSEAVYTVFFIGFLPGFLYLGGLNPTLHLDRKETPNLNVKKGSVAIGGKQTGIYPQDSPGGWHIIGNSPLELFKPKQNPPCVVKAGDKVKFNPITKSEYLRIQDDIKRSSFNIETI
ncbi:5-oxoprolinase subunit PxpB [Winogradskyella schleiferi]|uniref:5-oxoprolinase subunit PxpB n=1 Tax=Winogradskyella schleiferi TaxID=2686078 RepID=UPI0015BC77C7|nr:5-oxoprolinase subunit PxpB [Winogradskyella schleiferi]